jgi:hypothetical protein
MTAHSGSIGQKRSSADVRDNPKKMSSLPAVIHPDARNATRRRYCSKPACRQPAAAFDRNTQSHNYLYDVIPACFQPESCEFNPFRMPDQTRHDGTISRKLINCTHFREKLKYARRAYAG